MTENQPVVFVVDDDASVREALKDLLTSVGLQVELFGSAQEFLRSERMDVPSCLVLDVRLPGVSGLDFQEELLKANIHIPIIFITGHGDIPMSVRAMKAGAVEFLTKPFRDQDLIDSVQHALDRDRNRPQQQILKASGYRKTNLQLKLALTLAGVILATAVVVPSIRHLARNNTAARHDSSGLTVWSSSPPGQVGPRITGHIEVPVRASLSSSTIGKYPDQGNRWYLSAISADKVKLGDLAFAQIHGGAVVGVVDAGIDVNSPSVRSVLWELPPELATKYWPGGSLGYDFYQNRPNPQEELEDSHGTHVTGLVTGRQLAAWLPVFDEAGLAANVKAFSLKITGGDGSFDFTAAQNAIEAGITNNIRIFNLSLFGTYSQLLQQDLARAERQNSTLFIAAAGNDTTDLDANLEYHRTFRNEDGSGLSNVLFVAAIGDDGKLATFSNYGKQLVQIAAPGVEISSTVRYGKWGTLSGTSQAAPLVTFAAAIIKAEQPEIVPLAIKNRILNTCDWDDGLKSQVANGCKLNLLKAILCRSDLVELRSGELIRGDIDRKQFSSGLQTDSTLVRVWMVGPKEAMYVYASGQHERNWMIGVSIAVKLHFGEVCPHETVGGMCQLKPSEVKDVIFRVK
jgi:FixJ family two-component response regulator